MKIWRTTRAGFTLAEILCVVVIAGITAALVVPQIASRDDLRAAAAGRIVMADLIYAQNRAISLQRSQYVNFETSPGRYTLLGSPGLSVVMHPVSRDEYVTRFGASATGPMRETELVSAQFTGLSGATRPILAFDELGTPLVYNAADGTTETLRSGAVQLRSGSYTLQINVEPYTGQLSAAAVSP